MKTKNRTLWVRKGREAKVWRTYSMIPFFMVNRLSST